MAKSSTIKVPPAPPSAPQATPSAPGPSPTAPAAPAAPAAPPPPTEPAAPPQPDAGAPLTGSAPPAPTPGADANGGNPPENGVVTTNAEAKGAAVARDARKTPDNDGNGEGGGSLPDDPTARFEKISGMGWRDGRNADLNQDGSGRKVKAKPQKWSDAEYDRYVASYERGVQQKQADELSTDDRLARLERNAGLSVSGAEFPEDEDD